MGLQDDRAALECVDRALSLDPDLAVAWDQKALLLHSLDRHGEVLDCLDRSLAVDEGTAITWALRATALCQLGRMDEAEESCDAALVPCHR